MLAGVLEDVVVAVEVAAAATAAAAWSQTPPLEHGLIRPQCSGKGPLMRGQPASRRRHATKKTAHESQKSGALRFEMQRPSQGMGRCWQPHTSATAPCTGVVLWRGGHWLRLYITQHPPPSLSTLDFGISPSPFAAALHALTTSAPATWSEKLWCWYWYTNSPLCTT